MFRLKVRLHGSDVKDIALEGEREYTFGRSSECDVQLEGAQGISRQHFRIFESPTEGWTAQVISKFGDVNVAGVPQQTVKLENGTVFKLAGYDFMFYEQQSAVVSQNVSQIGSHLGSQGRSHSQEEASDTYAENSMPQAVGQNSMAMGSAVQSSAALVPAPQDFEGSDEATRVMETQAVGDVYIRIVESSGREETIKLEGRKWVAGREEGSQILLNDRKASRRQFELVSSPQGNFVRDLGSSNGTQLNGMPLAPDELKPLRSGDLLQVGALQIYFEVRDPHFDRRLSIVPKEVLQSALPVPQQIPFEMINYPVVQGPGGAVRVGPTGAPALYEPPPDFEGGVDAKAARTKKIRFILICAIVLLPLLYFAMNGSSEPQKAAKKDTSQMSPQMQAFMKLTPQKQAFVKEAYILGKNLAIQGKYALASEQMGKIHELLKDGYEDSHKIADDCENALQQERNRLAVEEEMKRAQQNKLTVAANLEKCKPIADDPHVFDESVFMSCLQPTIELDPENPAIAEGKLKIAARIAQRDQKNVQIRAAASRVARGEELFKKAEAIDKRGDSEGAVDAYKQHLAANLPDPRNLRTISKRRIAEIEGTKAASIAAYMSAAEQQFVNKDYKGAINNINKVKGLDPYNAQAAELNGKISHEKDQKLREIYEESILNEGLGQIDQAKANWKKIIEMDHPDGLYYKRAKNKMRSLGGI